MRLIDPKEFPVPSLTPIDNLIEVYKTCLLIQNLCTRNRISGLSALQVGIPWVLSVFCLKPNEWRYFLNYSYIPISQEKSPTLTRFVNVENNSVRYFMVQRYQKVEYKIQELIVNNQPEIVENIGVDPIIGLFIQNEYELSCGRLPHVEGVEYWIRQ